MLEDLQLKFGFLSLKFGQLAVELELGFPDLLDRGFLCLFCLLVKGLDLIFELGDFCSLLVVFSFQLLHIILIVFYLTPQNIHIRPIVLFFFDQVGYFLLCLFQK